MLNDKVAQQVAGGSHVTRGQREKAGGGFSCAAALRALGSSCWCLLMLVIRRNKSVAAREQKENDRGVWQWTKVTKFISIPDIVPLKASVSAD